MLPGILGVAIYQINVVVTRLLASFLEEGSVSWLYYGQRLFEFPQGVFVVSLAQAVLPAMSRQAASDDREGFRESLRFAMILILLVTVPAALGLVLCNQAVYSLLFMRGSFTAFDVSQAALALAWYAPGLLFVGISRVVVPSFYAMKDTRTPVMVSFWTLVVNVVFGLLLMQSMGHSGLALALTIASVFNAVVLTLLLSKRLGNLEISRISQTALRMIPGLVLMSLLVSFLLGQVDWMVAGSFWSRFGLLGFSVLCGCLVYAGALWLCGVKEMQQAWAIFARKLTLPSGKG
jgi:putative peptidoglycan lipid II flippase